MLDQLQSAKVIRDLHAHWKPHPAQLALIRAVFKHQHKIVQLDSGRKFGKTDWLIYVLLRWALFRKGEYYYLTPKQKQAKEIMWVPQRLQTFIPKHYIKSINNVEMRITLTNGSTIKLDGSDNYDVYRGINPHGIAYDEFKDFKPEFHEAMDPNLATHQAQLIIAGTPPDESEMPEDDDIESRAAQLHAYDAMMETCARAPDCSYWTFPSWANPHISREWLMSRREMLFSRGEQHIWYREYEAKRITGGRKNIFPMFDKEKHVKPHAEVMAEVGRDFSKLEFQIIADPGTSTCFGMLFRAINPYTQKVYVLDELYIRDHAKTSTSQVVPIKDEKSKELFRGRDVYQLYDEAAAWFRSEAMYSFDDPWVPTEKEKYDKDAGISLIKDQWLLDMKVVSDRCKFYIWEIENHKTNDKGKVIKKDDHLIDCDRYGNEVACISLKEIKEAHKRKSNRRGFSLAEDLELLPGNEKDQLERDFPTFDDGSVEWHDD